MRYIGVREDHLVDLVLFDQRLQLILWIDLDAIGVKLAGQLWRILAPIDIGNLRCRERDHVVTRIIAEVGIEIVKIAPSRTHNNDSYLFSHIETPF